MSTMENMMNDDRDEIGRLGSSMALAAQRRPAFIGGAMAIWESAHPGKRAVDFLQCDEAQAWKLAITPRPTGANMVRQALDLAADLGANAMALVNLLRFAESADAFASANDDGEMLMAALDAEGEEDKDR